MLSSPVPAPRIITYGTASHPQSPLHNSSAETVTPRGNPRTRKNLSNSVPDVPAEPDSDPSYSDFSSSDSSDSPDDTYYKRRRRAKENKKMPE